VTNAIQRQEVPWASQELGENEGQSCPLRLLVLPLQMARVSLEILSASKWDLFEDTHVYGHTTPNAPDLV
jgi:hypothetical protein